MQYLLLIYDREADFENLSEKEQVAIYQEYGALVAELKEKKIYLGGNPLKPTTTAATVRVRKGKKLVTDGPFAETKEQLGGYFLVDVKHLDEALEIAARIPTAREGSIEVRPIQPIGQAAQGA
jgi:hypothetical protein